MPNPFTTYQTHLANLRRAPVHNMGLAPHKPVLLLALLDRMEMGQPKDNYIPVDVELFGLFRRYWKQLVTTPHKCDITQPLHYLSDGMGWQLVGKDGTAVERKLGSQKRVLEEVKYGRFDPLFFQSLQSADNRMLARMVLLDTYFPETKGSYLQERPLPDYVTEIEQSIVEDVTPRYRQYTREIEGFVRDWKFPLQVMRTYQNTCCMSRLHLNPGFSIIEACHIVQHAHSGIDHITNGLALCVNLHRAFDHGLVALNDHYEVMVKPKVQEADSPYGVQQLKGQQILLPQNERFYPKPEYLRAHRKLHGF